MFASRWLFIALATVLFISEMALADKDGIYLGGGGSIATLNAEYNKSVINGSDSPRGADVVYSGSGRGDDLVGNPTLFGGYRFDLDDGYNFKVEASFTRYGDSVGGTIREAGNAPGPNEWGEIWREDWLFERSHGYNITLRLGTFFETISGEFYLLTGIGRIDAKARLEFEGCFRVAPCNGVGLEPGTLEFEETLATWRLGIGFERRLSDVLSLRIEYRRVKMADFEWTTTPEADGQSLRVPVRLPTVENSLLLGLAWYPR